MLLIKAGNPADARARNDKEEARRTHQERGRMEVGVGGRGREGREVEMWRLRALVGGRAGAGLWVKVTFRQVRQFILSHIGRRRTQPGSTYTKAVC